MWQLKLIVEQKTISRMLATKASCHIYHKCGIFLPYQKSEGTAHRLELKHISQEILPQVA